MTIDEIQAYLVKNNPNQNVKFIGRGSDSDAFRVGAFVYRFPHRVGTMSQYKTESEICDFVRGAVSVDIPKIEIHDGAVCFAKHKMIVGHKWRWHTFMFHPIKQARLATGIARFFAQLHGVNVSAFDTSSEKFLYVTFDDIADKIAPFLSARQMRFFQKKYNKIIGKRVPKRDIVMCHMGFKGANSVVDDAGHLVGVFDFGNAGVHERWRDLGVVYTGNNFPLYYYMLHQYKKLTGIKCGSARIADLGAIEHFTYKRWFNGDGTLCDLTDHRIKKYLAEALVRFYHLPPRCRHILYGLMTLRKRHFDSK